MCYSEKNSTKFSCKIITIQLMIPRNLVMFIIFSTNITNSNSTRTLNTICHTKKYSTRLWLLCIHTYVYIQLQQQQNNAFKLKWNTLQHSNTWTPLHSNSAIKQPNSQPLFKMNVSTEHLMPSKHILIILEAVKI